MKRYVAGLAMVVLVAAGCGDSSDDSDDASTTTIAATTDDTESDTDTDDTGDDTGEETGDDTDAGSASGSVTVDGATYDFSDVTTCEVGGETWGDDWRQFMAWSDDGLTHVTITVGSGEGEFLTGFDLAVGLANPRTLDEGNPDQEWTTDLGGSVSSTLDDSGASGSAEVTTLQVGGSIDATAEWSFTC